MTISFCVCSSLFLFPLQFCLPGWAAVHDDGEHVPILRGNGYAGVEFIPVDRRREAAVFATCDKAANRTAGGDRHPDVHSHRSLGNGGGGKGARGALAKSARPLVHFDVSGQLLDSDRIPRVGTPEVHSRVFGENVESPR